MEKITFVTDDGGKEEFYVEEQTRIKGVNYILVSDSQDDEAVFFLINAGVMINGCSDPVPALDGSCEGCRPISA